MEQGGTRPASAEGAFEESYWREESVYRKFADYHEGVEQTKRWYAGFVRMIRRHLPDTGRHVDAGCGHGAVVELLRYQGFDTHGFDTSEWIVEQGRGAGAADRLRVGDVESEIPFEGSFRLITCLEVLEHLEHPERALTTFAQRLEPGGRLIATTPNLHPRVPWPDPVAADPTHVSVHDPGWWAGRVEAAGLELLHAGTFITLPLAWRLTPALSLWLQMGAAAGPGILLVASRPGSR